MPLPFFNKSAPVKDFRGPLLPKGNLTLEDVKRSQLPQKKPELLFGPKGFKKEAPSIPKAVERGEKIKFAKDKNKAFKNILRRIDPEVAKYGNQDEITEEVLKQTRVASSQFNTPLTEESSILQRVGEAAKQDILQAEGELAGAAVNIANVLLPGRPLISRAPETDLAAYEEYLRTHAPERMLEHDIVRAEEGEQRTARFFGGTLPKELGVGAVTSGVTVAYARSLPVISKLRSMGAPGSAQRASGIMKANVIENLLQNASVSVMSSTMRDKPEDAMRMFMTNPSSLMTLHSIPNIAIGGGFDFMMSLAMGYSVEEALMNTAALMGGNFMQRKNIKLEMNASDTMGQLTKFKTHLLNTATSRFKPPKGKPTVISKEAANLAFDEAVKLHSYAKANPDDPQGLLKMAAEAEKKVTQLQQKVGQAYANQEKRLIRLTGPEGQPPKKPGEPKKPEPDLPEVLKPSKKPIPEEALRPEATESRKPIPKEQQRLMDEIESSELDLIEVKSRLSAEQAELERLPDLSVYKNKQGELPEVLGRGRSQFAREGDQMAKDLGFESSEDLRHHQENVVDPLKESIARLKNQRASLNKKIPALKKRLRNAKSAKKATPARKGLLPAKHDTEARQQLILDKKFESELSPADKAANQKFTDNLPQDMKAKAESGRPLTRKELVQMKSGIDVLPPSPLKTKLMENYKKQLKLAGTKEQQLGREVALQDSKIKSLENENKKLRAKADRKSHIEQVNKVKDKLNKAELRPEHKEVLKGFLASAEKTSSPIHGMQDMVTKLRKVQADMPDQMPEEMLESIAGMEGKKLVELTKGELEDLYKLTTFFIHASKIENKMMIEGKLVDAEVIAKQAIREIADYNVIKRPSVAEIDTTVVKRDKAAKKYRKAIKHIVGPEAETAETMVEVVAGPKHGILHKIFIEDIHMGRRQQLEMQQSAEEFVKSKLKEIGIDVSKWSPSFQKKAKKLEKKTLVFSNGRKVTLTRSEWVDLFLSTLDPDGYRHITWKKGGWSPPGEPTLVLRFNEADVKLIQEKISHDEEMVAGIVNELFNSKQKTKINERSMEMTGLEVATEGENYYPIDVSPLDPRFPKKISQPMFRLSLAGQGIFKKRNPFAKQAILGKDVFSKTLRTIHQVSAYYGLAKPIRNARLLLQDPQFRKTMIDAGHEERLKLLDEYVNDIESTPIRNASKVDNLAIEAINLPDRGIVGLQPIISIKQRISVWAAATEIDTKHMMKGTKISSPSRTKKAKAEMLQHSPIMKERLLKGKISTETGELAEIGETRRFWTGKTPVLDKGMIMIRKMDASVMVDIWESVKVETRALHPKLTGDAFWKRVALRHEEVVRRTQPMFDRKDRSTIARSRQAFTRTLIKYTSQLNQNFNIQKRETIRFIKGAKTTENLRRYMRNMSLIALLSSFSIVAINLFQKMLLHKKVNLSPLSITIDMLQAMMAPLYFINVIAFPLRSKVQYGTFGGFDVSTPLGSLINQGLNATATSLRAAWFAWTGERFERGEYAGDTKFSREWRKAMLDSGDVIMRFKGVNVHFTRQLIEGTVRRAKLLTK